MNENSTTRPGITAKGELTLIDIAAVAGPDFAEWLCGLFGGDMPSPCDPQPAAEAQM